MAQAPETRVYLEAGGHVDVGGTPWQVAYMLWGRDDSDDRPRLTRRKRTRRRQ